MENQEYFFVGEGKQVVGVYITDKSEYNLSIRCQIRHPIWPPTYSPSSWEFYYIWPPIYIRRRFMRQTHKCWVILKWGKRHDNMVFSVTQLTPDFKYSDIAGSIWWIVYTNLLNNWGKIKKYTRPSNCIIRNFKPPYMEVLGNGEVVIIT